MKNERAREHWNGAAGERWALHQEGLEARIRVFGRDVLDKAALRAGMRVLDVGCGCGETTREAAGMVSPTGHVVGVDISRPMLARGREQLAALASVELLEEDAATFQTTVPFDAVISRFGVMFFDDPEAAFANLRAATRPGGALTFVCWRTLEENPWAKVPLAAVLTVVPPPPPRPANAPGPFALGNAEHLRGILARAGWSDVELTPRVHPMKLGASLEEAVQYTSQLSPSGQVLLDADEATFARAVEVLRETLAPLAPGFLLDGAVWVVSARA